MIWSQASRIMKTPRCCQCECQEWRPGR